MRQNIAVKRKLPEMDIERHFGGDQSSSLSVPGPV
jgi:hypothetical protein